MFSGALQILPHSPIHLGQESSYQKPVASLFLRKQGNLHQIAVQKREARIFHKTINLTLTFTKVTLQLTLTM